MLKQWEEKLHTDYELDEELMHILKLPGWGDKLGAFEVKNVSDGTLDEIVGKPVTPEGLPTSSA